MRIFVSYFSYKKKIINRVDLDFPQLTFSYDSDRDMFLEVRFDEWGDDFVTHGFLWRE
jgi:hypothetical protein